MAAGGEWALSDFKAHVDNTMAALESRIILLEAEMNAKTTDRYHASDAARDFALRDQRDNDQDRRLDNLERRIP